MVVMLLMLSLAHAGEVDVHYQQARLHLRRGWYEAADEELRAALAAPGGRERYEVCWLASDVALAQLDVERAADLAAAAARVAPDAASASAATTRATQLREQFGAITVTAPHPGMTSTLQLESTGLIVNPEWKTLVDRAAQQWQERTALPARLVLPAGSYTVNGQSVTISGGQEVSLSLPMQALDTAGPTALQLTVLEASAGVRAYGGTAAAQLPRPVVQAAVSQPVGPLLLGAVGRYSPASTAHDDVHLDLAGQVGWGLRPAPTLLVSPRLRAGWARFPGIPEAWFAGAELAIEARDVQRTTALGSGVSFVADQTWSRGPEAGSAPTLSMLAHLSLSL